MKSLFITIMGILICVLVSTAVFVIAGNAATIAYRPLTVESTFKVSGGGTAFAATVSILDQWDVNDVRLGINTDPIVGGFWLRFAKDGVITDYNLGIADANYHMYKIEYDGSSVKIYIDHVLKKTLSITLTNVKIALHTNARAIGDAVSAQFDNIDIAADKLIFTDNFEDGTIDPIWTIKKADWMSVREQDCVLDMTGTATEQFWKDGGTAAMLISDLILGRPLPTAEMVIDKVEIDLKDGKFEIKGTLDVTDPDFANLILNPQSRLLLELQTIGTADKPVFGIVGEDQVQLITDDDLEELKFELLEEE